MLVLLCIVLQSHRYELFAAIKAAYAHPEHCIDPLLRKDYVRLTKAIALRAEGVLSKQQRTQLEVYSIWALLRNELFTDDSFAYNKVVAKIKTTVAELSDGDLDQEAAWNLLHSPDGASSQQQQQRQQQMEHGSALANPAAAATAGPAAPAVAARVAAAPAAAVKEAAEADPFGLDEFIAQQEAQAAAGEAAAAAAAAPEAAAQQDHTDAASAAKFQQGAPWGPVTIEIMKKQALLDCLIAAKEHQHKLAWARTSVEILIEDVAKPSAQGGFADKFVGGQKQQLQELLKFVNAERAARRSGVNRRPGGKGTGDYQTSFERARAEWSAASWVSARGKVGTQGDAKAQNWLG